MFKDHYPTFLDGGFQKPSFLLQCHQRTKVVRHDPGELHVRGHRDKVGAIEKCRRSIGKQWTLKGGCVSVKYPHMEPWKELAVPLGEFKQSLLMQRKKVAGKKLARSRSVGCWAASQ